MALATQVERTKRSLGSSSTAGRLKAILDSLLLKNILGIPGLTSSARELMLRLKSRLLGTFWNKAVGNLSCPHGTCSNTDSAYLDHVLWNCPHAQTVWSRLVAHWGTLGVDFQGKSLEAVFGLDLPNSPDRLAESIENKLTTLPAEDVSVAIHPFANLVWKYSCVTYIAAIWSNWSSVQRGSPFVRDDPETLYRTATARLATGLRDLCHLIDKYAPGQALMPMDILRMVTEASIVKVQLPAAPIIQAGTVYLLFIDGGSRGNPGPGGSGSVMVKITQHSPPSIMWYASMVYSQPTTTNNKAECSGLFHGLRYAATNGCSPLFVIGDSEMIIGQMRENRPPKKSTIRSTYARCLMETRKLRVEQWCHHPRAYNKMADQAANIAMDSRRSRQCDMSSVPSHGQIDANHLTNDVQYWLNETGCTQTYTWLDSRNRSLEAIEFVHTLVGEPRSG